MNTAHYSMILIEDDREIREDLEATFNNAPEFNLLFCGSTVNEGITALKNLKPDILLTDLCLERDQSGIDIIKAIHHLQLDTQALVLTGFQDEHLVFAALKAGAGGYILKHDDSQTITDNIITMMNGGAPISPIIARLMLQKFQHHQQNNLSPETLTEKQIQILKFVSQGFSSREIAEKLSLSYHTVTTHIRNIYSKLQVNSRTEALFEAAKLGLID